MRRSSDRKSRARAPGLLGRLARDQRGASLAIVAASVVPIIGVIGGAMDLSRIYLAKSRIQQACDASVLAGRRSMVGLTWSTASEATAREFFTSNFPAGKYGSTGTGIVYNVNSEGSVSGVASGQMPMTLMRVFNVNTMPITANCTAELHLPNTDIMFVVDTTGSMADTNPGDSSTRIVALRAAVQSFYTTLESVKTAGSIIRYGFMPYSETVNVGKLLKREWMVDRWTYQSREPDGAPEPYTTTNTTTTTTTQTSAVYVSGTVQTIYSFLPLEDCTAPSNTVTTNQTYTEVRTPYPGGGQQIDRHYTRTRNGSSYSVGIVSGQCRLTETKYTAYVDEWDWKQIPVGSTTTTTGFRYYWNYKPIEYDVSMLKGVLSTGLMAGTATVPTVTGNNHTVKNVAWNGCIEERDTVRDGNYAAAKDLDIDLVPISGDASTQWRPALAKLVFARTSLTAYVYAPVNHNTSNFTIIGDYMSGTYAVCPAQARKLATITSSQLTTYLNTLTPSGQTYHDIGLIWGARFISPTGLFASENSVASNGGSIARHMIFMTDGDTDTEITHYDAYGWPALDRRRSSISSAPTKTGQDAEVAARTTYMCNAIKAKGITLWVIAFGTSLTTMLQNCATNGRAYEADNTAELNQAFSEIASQIAQLRITK